MSNIVKGDFKKTETSGMSEEDVMNLLTDQSAPEDSSAYAMVQVVYTPDQLEQKRDVLDGSNRNRKWGAQVAVGIIPNVDKIPTGNITLAQAPAIFVDADDVETLRERIIYEVDKAIAIAQLSLDNPDLLRKVSETVISKLSSSVEEEGSDTVE